MPRVRLRFQIVCASQGFVIAPGSTAQLVLSALCSVLIVSCLELECQKAAATPTDNLLSLLFSLWRPLPLQNRYGI